VQYIYINLQSARCHFDIFRNILLVNLLKIYLYIITCNIYVLYIFIFFIYITEYKRKNGLEYQIWWAQRVCRGLKYVDASTVLCGCRMGRTQCGGGIHSSWDDEWAEDKIMVDKAARLKRINTHAHGYIIHGYMHHRRTFSPQLVLAVRVLFINSWLSRKPWELCRHPKRIYSHTVRLISHTQYKHACLGTYILYIYRWRTRTIFHFSWPVWIGSYCRLQVYDITVHEITSHFNLRWGRDNPRLKLFLTD
jgi:hypothetical protein